MDSKAIVECRQICVATAQQTLRLLYYAKERWLGYRLRKLQAKALLRMGQRMYKSGVGDSSVVKQIAALTSQIESPGQKVVWSWLLKRERRRLTLRLAEIAIGQSSSPIGIEAEFREVKTGEANMKAARQHQEILRAALLPADGMGWRRVGIGYGLSILAIFLMLFFLHGTVSSGKPQPVAQQSPQPVAQQSPPASPLVASRPDAADRATIEREWLTQEGEPCLHDGGPQTFLDPGLTWWHTCSSIEKIQLIETTDKGRMYRVIWVGAIRRHPNPFFSPSSMRSSRMYVKDGHIDMIQLDYNENTSAQMPMRSLKPSNIAETKDEAVPVTAQDWMAAVAGPRNANGSFPSLRPRDSSSRK